LFPALVKQHGLGTLVGRPTGGPDAVTFGNAFLLSMPNTDLVFRLASARVAFGEDDTPDVRGVQPDVPVERSVHDAVRGIDTDLVRVFELIDERRATLAGDD
jgi:C-terminal processing protease CtpA/Prc